MNDRPPSGQYPETGYDGLTTTTFAGDQAYVSYETQGQGYNYGVSGTYDAYGSYESTGTYDATAWASQESYLTNVPTQGAPEDTTGQWDASAWTSAGSDYQPASFGYESGGAEQTGQWSTFTGYPQDTGAYDATAWNGGADAFDLTGPATVTASVQDYPSQSDGGYAYAYGHDTTQAAPADSLSYEAAYEPAYEATTVVPITVVDPYPSTDPYPGADPYANDERHTNADPYANNDTYANNDLHAADTAVFEAVTDALPDDVPEPRGAVHDMPTQAMPVTPRAENEPRPTRRAGAPAKGAAKNSARAGGSSRRRTPAKRSALLTVAVPSACVMGVAGVAAASVGGLAGGAEKPAEEPVTMAAPDPASVKPIAANNKLDTQLAALSADAGDFADRASRTQERIDLRERQLEEKKKRAEEAAAKEAARPKFAVPVAQHGLSAGFGQAGGMWMSVHTGIDFPVSYGTPVMAATDGTVRTQFNSAYGNMAILTSPDGTETWYCHLSSTKIRSGKVKAGEVIAYSGNSGNSTGPHLHFEVRPGGGSPIDPQAWLRSHGLDPS
ncbi:peptidoglycan DD-metalloendopeptidase family protein [Streptomyces sp. NPDC054949]|uniref:M23 family metallopeptidase n=1 Tax=unclassified Streptomyces TaxID=2593676 RepID=UPI002251C76D|nr:peptidoglycan DD-metalloendopeptidase family protein [Streptomyces sp. NBC_00291]MCX5154654.1 peptidoglycan DD-metalloendopeptidase family protein [Streptomyces sp. NBC_00291]